MPVEDCPDSADEPSPKAHEEESIETAPQAREHNPAKASGRAVGTAINDLRVKMELLEFLCFMFAEGLDGITQTESCDDSSASL